MSYLPHIKEEVDKIAKNPKIITICVIFCLVIAAGSWLLCRHYDNIKRTDSHDVVNTVRNIEDINRDAQNKLEDARNASQRAEQANQNAQRAADSLADSNAKLSELNGSDAGAIDAAESVFRNVDAANQ